MVSPCRGLRRSNPRSCPNSTVLFPDLSSYRLVDQQTLTLRVAAAPCSWTRATGVTETAADIRIKVETLPCPINFLPHTDELDFQDVTVSLAHDVANRIIADSQGEPIPLAPGS